MVTLKDLDCRDNKPNVYTMKPGDKGESTLLKHFVISCINRQGLYKFYRQLSTINLLITDHILEFPQDI